MAVPGPTPLPVAPARPVRPVLHLDALLQAAALEEPVASTSNLEQPLLRSADGADDLLALLRDLTPSQVDDLRQLVPTDAQQKPARRKELRHLVEKAGQKRQTTTSSSNNGYCASPYTLVCDQLIE